MGDVIMDGVMMIVMLFVITLCYVFFSGPFEEMMTSFDNLDGSLTDSYVESGTGVDRTVFNLVFAVLGCIPVIWFIVRMFQREPDWGFKS